MRMRRHLTLWLLAAGALGVFVPGTASAAQPEIGRCTKLEPVQEGRKKIYSGKYTNKKCTKVSASAKGKYEWAPGAGEEKTFKTTGTLEPVVIETAGKQGLHCKTSKMAGEYTSATTETLKIALTECLEIRTEKYCQSESVGPEEHRGEVNSLTLEGHLGYIKAGGKRPEVGWEYKPQTGSDLFVFECGQVTGIGTKVVISGSFIGQVHKTVNRMTEEYFLRYDAARGKNTPEMFEGGTKASLEATLLNIQEDVDVTEPIGYRIQGEEEQEPEEELEIKATP
jgi:hypothetical protein